MIDIGIFNGCLHVLTRSHRSANSPSEVPDEDSAAVAFYAIEKRKVGDSRYPRMGFRAKFTFTLGFLPALTSYSYIPTSICDLNGAGTLPYTHLFISFVHIEVCV